MTDVSVACSCGRTMAPDVMAGYGAFRCGCGARIAVTVTRAASCTGLAENGQRCRLVPVREAAQFGLSLCRRHYQGYLDMLDLIREGERASEKIEILSAWTADDEAARQEHEEYRRLCAEQAVVYYVRIRDLIKIGTTTNMKARMLDLLIDEVLATEPGGEDLETMRHEQFRHLKVRGERFTPAPDLLSHIAMIREHFGEPRITGRVPYDRKALATAVADRSGGALQG